jgi:hypothetical protein
MPQPIPDFDASSDPANIRRILDYLDRLTDVPGPAIDALRGLLAQVERRAIPDEAVEDAQTVIVPEHTRREHERAVQLVEVTFTCRMCGITRTMRTYPGRQPNICQGEDGKRSKCQRDANRERMKALRARKREV